MDETLIFLLKTFGLGILTGFIFGFLSKKLAKLLVFLLAAIVILVVILGHNEILNIDWLSIKDKGLELINQFANNYSERLKLFLSNIPFIIGLLFGAILGLKKG